MNRSNKRTSALMESEGTSLSLEKHKDKVWLKSLPIDPTNGPILWSKSFPFSWTEHNFFEPSPHKWIPCIISVIVCLHIGQVMPFVFSFWFSSSFSAMQEKRTTFYHSGQYSTDTPSLVTPLPSLLDTIFFHFLQIHQRKLSLRHPASWISWNPTWHSNYQPFNILSWVNQGAHHFPHHTKLSLWWLHYLCQLSTCFFCYLSFSFSVNHLSPIYLADKVLFFIRFQC